MSLSAINTQNLPLCTLERSIVSLYIAKVRLLLDKYSTKAVSSLETDTVKSFRVLSPPFRVSHTLWTVSRSLAPITYVSARVLALDLGVAPVMASITEGGLLCNQPKPTMLAIVIAHTNKVLFKNIPHL
jgi:hypothetical protein